MQSASTSLAEKYCNASSKSLLLNLKAASMLVSPVGTIWTFERNSQRRPYHSISDNPFFDK